MTPSKNISETIFNETLIPNETLTEVVNRVLKKTFNQTISNQTISEKTYITSLALAKKELRVLVKKEIGYVLIGMSLGFLVHRFCREIIQKNPDFFKDDTAEKKIRLKNLLREILQNLRGGALIELETTLLSVVIKKLVINIAAVSPGTASIIGGVGLAGVWFVRLAKETKIDLLAKALPKVSTALTYVPVGEITMLTDIELGIEDMEQLCSHNLNYLFRLLLNDKLPYQEKAEMVNQIIGKYLDWHTCHGRVVTFLCLVSMLYMLFVLQSEGYYLLMKALIKAFKEGRISGAVVRTIIRKLTRKGVYVDPALVKIVEQS